MSARGISKEDAERLLRGLPAGHGPLSDLLAAVAVPGTARELAGEEAAVATFRSALENSPVVVLGRTSSTRGNTRALTAKAVGLAMAVTAVCGGVAIATNSADRPQPTVAPSVTTPPPVSPTAQPTLPPLQQQPLRQKQAPKAMPKKKKKQLPTALADVCRAFFGKNIATGDLERLIKAAGGRKNLLSFCYTLLGGKQTSGTESPEDGERFQRWIDENRREWEKYFPPR